MPRVSLPFSTKSSRRARLGFSFIFSSSPLRSSEFWRFFANFAKLVVVPGLIAVLFAELLAWRTGATIANSVPAIAELQHEDPNIVWTGNGQLYGPLALARIKIEQPDIIMIGHSRCGQMRSMMFKPYSFHNACLSAWTFGQIKTMIDLATRLSAPKTVMFDLDYFMLGDAYAKAWEATAFMDFAPPARPYLDGLLELASAFNRHPAAMFEAMPFYLFGRAHEPVDGLELFGPHTIYAQAGFRSDGSLLYDPVSRSQAPVNRTELPRLIAAVPNGDGVHPGSAQMRALAEIGELGRQRHLTLVGVQLPIIQGALDILDSNEDWEVYRSADRGNWRLLRSAGMKQELNQMGIHFFDLTRDPIANEPRAFLDPAHPSEYGTGIALLDAMKGDPELRALFPRLDLGALQGALAEARQQGRFFDVYGVQF
jgi:hypothetical protein